MNRSYEYDESRAASKPIELHWKDDTFVLPGDAPLDVAMDWYTLQSDQNLTTAARMQKNYGMILGETNFELMKSSKVPWLVVDSMYRDVLHEWGLWRKTTTRTESMVTIIERLRKAVEIGKPRDALMEIVDALEAAFLDPGVVAEDDSEPEKESSSGEL